MSTFNLWIKKHWINKYAIFIKYTKKSFSSVAQGDIILKKSDDDIRRCKFKIKLYIRKLYAWNSIIS